MRFAASDMQWVKRLAWIMLLALPEHVHAEEVLSRSAIVEQLAPTVLTRGLVLVEDPEPASVVFGNIQFRLDSHELTALADQQIVEIAAALNDETLVPFRFEIAGHTDASGTQAYNQALSEARANSVVERLVALGVAPERLDSRGWGERRLLADLPPADEGQRRVELINLGSR